MNIEVSVKPGSKKGSLVDAGINGNLIIYVRSPAVDGKANTAVIKLLAAYFSVSKSHISIVRGQTSRTKIVHIENTI